MQSADASTPEPVYGRPRSSNMPWTVPSSPRRPCRALKTQSKPPSRRHPTCSHRGRSPSPGGRTSAGLSRPGLQSAARPRARPTSHRAEPRSSLPAPHHLDLGLELDAGALLDRGHDPLDQAAHVGGRRASLVDDEVAVQRRHDSRTLTLALQTRGLDEPARRIAFRVDENAAAVLGLDRLGLVALAGERGHHLLRLLAVAPLELDGRRDDERALERAVAQRRRPVAETELARGPRSGARP